MNPISLAPWAWITTAAVLMGLLTFAGCEHSNAKSARADEKVAVESTRVALDANKSNQVTIKMLKVAIEQWKSLATPAANMQAAAAKAAELERENERLNAALAKREEADYKKPDCIKLLETDFEAVCPIIAKGLRERSERRP